MNTITKIALADNRENRTRSRLIFIAILLTSMLLTSIGTFVYGGIKGNVENAETLFGNYVAVYTAVDDDQLHELKKRGEIGEIGCTGTAGETDTKGSSDLVWADDNAIIMNNAERALITGRLPEEKNELASSESFFSQLGYHDVKVGDRITVPVRQNKSEPYRNEEFAVSGILEDGTGNMNQQTASVYVSEDYYKKAADQNRSGYNVFITLDEDVKGNWDEIRSVIASAAEQCGIDERNVIVNSNLISSMYSPDMEMIIPCVVMCAIVVIFSAVVIYNIFQIGIARKIQEYGKIKAIGATGKQMKKIIVREGMYLALYAVPVGLAAGYAVTALLFRSAMEFVRAENEYLIIDDVSVFSPYILAGAAAVSFITVRIAMIRAVRTVKSITPVKAFSYDESEENQKGYREGHSALGVRGLIRSDFMFNKKRNIVTIVVMGLSCILFIVTATLTSSIDPAYDARNSVERGDYQIELNYDNSDKVYRENNLDHMLENNPISDEAINRLSRTDGVEKIQTRKYLTFNDEGTVRSVAVFDREGFESELKRSGVVGDFTYDSVSRADGFIYPYSYFMEESGEKIGDTIDVKLENGEKSAEYKGRAMGSFGSVSADYIITEDTAEKLGIDGDNHAYLWIWCSDDAEAVVEQTISAMYDKNDHVYWEAFDDVYSLNQKSKLLFKVFAYSFLGMIGIICFLNMANTMIMNVITRKREFGILQAVGMSNRQLGRMLQIQGMTFTAGAVMIALIMGIPAGYGAFLYSKDKGFFGMNVYHFPLMEIAVMAAALLIMQAVLSYVLSRNIKNESVIDRIRY